MELYLEEVEDAYKRQMAKQTADNTVRCAVCQKCGTQVQVQGRERQNHSLGCR
jgi:hypothetical protein